MEHENRNRSRYASDENWDQNQPYGNVNDSYSRQNRPDHQRNQNYGNQNLNSGYGRNEEDNYSGMSGSGNQQWGRQQNYGQSGYSQGGANYGTSDFGSQDHLGNYGSNYGRQDYGGNNFGSSYGQDYNQRTSQGNSHGDNYSRRDQQWNNRNYASNSGQHGESGNMNYGNSYGSQRNQNIHDRHNEPRNRYGGDTSNYGNANQGGFDRSWWDRAKDEVSSWFGDDDNDRRNRDRNTEGPHRGKGPKGYKRSDERIREDVCDRLCDNPMIDASNIDIKVEGSEVILTGTVDSREDKRRAEDIAESISGVSNVQNQLRVSHRDWNSNNEGRSSNDRHRNDSLI